MVDTPVKPITASGLTFTSRQPLMSASRYLTDGDIKAGKKPNGSIFTAGNTTQGVELPYEISRNAARSADPVFARTVLARFPSALRPSVNEDNKARLEVWSRGDFDANRPNLIGTFTDFICAQVQETDTEKVSVAETFGDPHIFASGRFIRKFTFVGVLRTAPPNYTHESSVLRVPQSVAMERFYDKYLRATEQVRLRRFTRLIIDGELYEGYVTTFNIHRSADREQFADLTCTMYGIRRGHTELEAAADRLLSAFRQKETEKARDIDRKARVNAEIQDARFRLNLRVHKEVYGSQGFTATTKPLQFDPGDLKVQTIGVHLAAFGGEHIVRVSDDAPPGSIRLGYSEGGQTPTIKPMHGYHAIVANEGEPGQMLALEILNAAKLIEHFSGSNTLSTTHKGEIQFTITGDTVDRPVVITCPVTLEGVVRLTCTKVELYFTDTDVPPVTLQNTKDRGESLSDVLKHETRLPGGNADKSVFQGNSHVVSATFHIKALSGDFDLQSLAGSLFNILPTIKNVSPTLLGDDRRLTAAGSPGSPVVNPKTGTITVPYTVDFTPSTDVPEGAPPTLQAGLNPFKHTSFTTVELALQLKASAAIQRYTVTASYEIQLGKLLNASDFQNVVSVSALPRTYRERKDGDFVEVTASQVLVVVLQANENMSNDQLKDQTNRGQIHISTKSGHANVLLGSPWAQDSMPGIFVSVDSARVSGAFRKHGDYQFAVHILQSASRRASTYASAKELAGKSLDGWSPQAVTRVEYLLAGITGDQPVKPLDLTPPTDTTTGSD